MPIGAVVADANVLLSPVVGGAALRVLTEFGVAYAEYQRHVPRLIPRLKRCYPPTQNKT